MNQGTFEKAIKRFQPFCIATGRPGGFLGGKLVMFYIDAHSLIFNNLNFLLHTMRPLLAK